MRRPRSNRFAYYTCDATEHPIDVQVGPSLAANDDTVIQLSRQVSAINLRLTWSVDCDAELVEWTEHVSYLTLQWYIEKQDPLFDYLPPEASMIQLHEMYT